MDTTRMRMEILRLIANNDGKLSWYQLDRSLSHDEFLPIMDQMMPLLEQLEQDGLIKSEGEAPRYRVTDAGQAIVEQQAVAA